MALGVHLDFLEISEFCNPAPFGGINFILIFNDMQILMHVKKKVITLHHIISSHIIHHMVFSTVHSTLDIPNYLPKY